MGKEEEEEEKNILAWVGWRLQPASKAQRVLGERQASVRYF